MSVLHAHQDVPAASNSMQRPTPAELQEAREVIRLMKQHDPPILALRAPAKPNVVACAIAMSRGECFQSDAKALKLFGVATDTKVRRDWVQGKLVELARAGLFVPGELALPAYSELSALPEPMSFDAEPRETRHDSSCLGSTAVAEDSHCSNTAAATAVAAGRVLEAGDFALFDALTADDDAVDQTVEWRSWLEVAETAGSSGAYRVAAAAGSNVDDQHSPAAHGSSTDEHSLPEELMDEMISCVNYLDAAGELANAVANEAAGDEACELGRLPRPCTRERYNSALAFSAACTMHACAPPSSARTPRSSRDIVRVFVCMS